MADWIELFKERYLSVDKMNAIYNDFQVINELLAEKGYIIYDLTDNTVTYGISPALILDKMNAVESNIQSVENAIDWINPYYSLFEWAHDTYEKKPEVDRWIMYLNFVYGVLTGTLKAAQYLIDSKGNYIIDKTGNYILVYKEDENGQDSSV